MIESFDGLCGTIAPSTSDLQFRCKYTLIHSGDHSWEKYRSQFQIIGGTYVRIIPEEGFLNSVNSGK